MADKQAKAAMPLLYAFDAGNGRCKGVSSETQGVITFEPVIARLTTKKGVPNDDEKPAYSLQVDGDTWVFGVDDVFAHGKRASIRRLNTPERYTNADYFLLLKVLFLHVFAAHRGNGDHIKPTGVISLPISQYNNDDTVGEIRTTLCGKMNLVDMDGCELRIEIQDKRLVIVPESYGALMHYAYDLKSGKKRATADTSGSTLVIDIGYETTDVSLFEGLKYQRDQSYTIQRAGMGIVARSIHDYVDKAVKGADVSRIDRELQSIAGVAIGAKKMIQPLPGVMIDVTEVYDSEIVDLGTRIAQGVATNTSQDVNRILLAGGGDYHLSRVIDDQLTGEIASTPDPDVANVLGTFTMLQIQARG